MTFKQSRPVLFALLSISVLISCEGGGSAGSSSVAFSDSPERFVQDAIAPDANGGITYSLHLQGVDSIIANEITQSMAEATQVYNANGLFDKHINVYYSAGVPTAQANFGGVMTFGNARNVRVAIHEISHTLGVGAQPAYLNLMNDGQWYGSKANTLLASFDGAGAVLNGDSKHIWPYGLNYDSEDSDTNRVRHVKIVEAMRCDMNIGSCELAGGDVVVEGRNRTIFNRASGKVLDADGNSNGSNSIIYSDYGNANQRWNIINHGDDEYSFRSEQGGGLALDTWNWGTENGTNIALYGYWSGRTQRFYIDEVESGWYRITPVIATDQCIDAYGTNSGANVGTWSWSGGENQQWSIR